MKKEDKSLVISQIKETVESYSHFYLTDAEGLNAEQVSDLRRLCFKSDVKMLDDLTLAGHMHGGMIYIPFKGGVFSPEKVYFPEYDGGLYEKNNKMMVVNRGIGSGSKGFRILNPPEITEIILMKR